MDYPIVKAAPGGDTSLLLRVTREALVACLLCLFAAFGILLMNERLLQPLVRPILSMQRIFFLCSGAQSWWLLPYLWLSFLAIELVHRHER